MRLYYAAYGLFLVIAIIDFAVTAPVPVGRKPQTEILIIHKTEHAKTKLGKWGAELDGLLSKLFDHPETHPPARPEEQLPAAGPSSSSQPLRPSDVPTNVEQPGLFIPNEPSQAVVPSHALSGIGNDPLKKLWLLVHGKPLPDESLPPHPSWGPLPTLPVYDWPDFGKPVSPVHNEPSQAASPVHSAPILTDDALNKMWLDHYGQHIPDKSLATQPPWGSMSSGHTQGWMDTEQPVPSVTNELEYGHGLSDESFAAPPWDLPPSGPAHGWMDAEHQYIPNEPSQAASTVHLLPVPDNDAHNNLWLHHYGQHFPDKSLAIHPSWGPPSSGHTQGWMDTEQPVPSITNELEYGHGLSDESFAAPPWDLPPSGPAHGWMDVGHQYIPNEPSQAVGTVYSPPVPGNDVLNNLWVNHYGQHYPESLATHPPWGSPSSGHVHGSMDIEQPVPSITNELEYGHGFSDESFTALPSWALTPSGLAHGWTNVEQPAPSIPNDLSYFSGSLEPPSWGSPPSILDDSEPSREASLRHAQQVSDNGQHFSDESLDAHSWLGSPPSGSAHGWKNVEQPEPSYQPTIASK